MAKPRYFKNYADVKIDSDWEKKLLTGVMKGVPYHTIIIPYVIDHKYHPDWVHNNIIIEAKGRFRESSEASKYKWVREVLKEGDELVFLFMKPYLAMPHAKKRKDGTKQTHAEWAEKNGFRWFSEETIHEILT